MPRTQTPLDKIKTAPPLDRPTTRPKVARKRGVNPERPKDIETARLVGINTSSKAVAALVDMNKPLTRMQKDFVKHWAAGESILAASYRAGYADGGTYAYRMVAMPNILALYNAEKKAYEEASFMSKKKVMDMLIKAYDHAELAGEPASMVAAAREVGKMCGYYEPVRQKIDLTVNDGAQMQRIARLSDAELLKLIMTPSPEAPLQLTDGAHE